MTEGNKNHPKAGDKDDDKQRKEATRPVVTLRPRSGTKTWPRILRFYLNDGTPIEDLMMP